MMNGMNIGSTGVDVDYWKWCRHIITMASTDAAYGPANPFKEKVVEDGFW
jgi:hypothetical protein